MLAPPVGMLGGMFDPVHFGHLRSAVELRAGLALSAVHLVPCAHPPHRAFGVATAEQRIAMLQLAVADEPGLYADDRELKRSGPSYSIDTLTSLRAEHPAAPLCLIVGMDAFNSLPTWHRWTELFDLAHVVVMQRPGNRSIMPPVLEQMLITRRIEAVEQLRHRLAGSVLFFPVTQLAISSTTLRHMLARGESLRFLVPDAVYDYIKSNHPYSGGAHASSVN